jgi:hypothetical protein
VWNRVARLLAIAFGALAIAWSAEVIPLHRIDQPLANTANAILSGEVFDITRLRALMDRLDKEPPRILEASGLDGVALIRISLLEQQLNSPDRAVSITDYDKARLDVGAALARSPANPFMWLSAFALKRLRGEPAADDLNLLRMSYRLGPNEGWIAIRRNPISVSAFASLPQDLQDAALQEFVGLVQSGFHDDAANVLAGPGWPIRGQLLGRLINLDEDTRRQFANVLASRDLEDVVVPGLQARRRDGWR